MPRRLLSIPFISFAGSAFAQATAPTPAPDLGGSLWQLFLGLGLVLVLLVGSLWLLKRLATPRGGNAGLLRVVAGAAVGARERVVIVEIGSTWLVLGVAPGHVSALAEVPRQAGAASPPAGAVPVDGFPEWLRRLTPGR